uniref:hypothetical protein n=1 Tax=Rheinheimera sp. TaxID=1869214 RepID=UPI004048ACB0
MSKEKEQSALSQINEVFSEKAKNALAIAMVTQSGEVLYHYAATGGMSHNVEDAAYVIEMIKKLSDSNK